MLSSAPWTRFQGLHTRGGRTPLAVQDITSRVARSVTSMNLFGNARVAKIESHCCAGVVPRENGVAMAPQTAIFSIANNSAKKILT